MLRNGRQNLDRNCEHDSAILLSVSLTDPYNTVSGCHVAPPVRKRDGFPKFYCPFNGRTSSDEAFSTEGEVYTRYRKLFNFYGFDAEGEGGCLYGKEISREKFKIRAEQIRHVVTRCRKELSIWNRNYIRKVVCGHYHVARLRFGIAK